MLSTLALITMSAGHIFEESLGRDLWKAAKSNSTDKSGKVIAASFELFRSLVTHRIHFKSISDYETLKSSVQKALDSPFPVARQSAAKCFASCLILLSNAPLPQLVQEKLPKGKEIDEGENERTGSPAPSGTSSSKIKLPYALSFNDSLLVLASIYTHSTSTTRVRIGVTQALTAFIMDSDSALMESKVNDIAVVFLVNILSDPNIVQHRHKFILARKHAKFIITHVFARQVLGEIGQISLIKFLTNEILKNYPKVLKEQGNISKETLVGTLECVESLLLLIGSAVSNFSGTLKDTLLQLIVHPSYTVQVAVAACFQQLINFTPSLIIPLLNTGLSTIQKTVPLISTKKAHSHQVTGYALLVSILNKVTYDHPLYTSIDLASRVLSTATSILKETGEIDVFTSALQVQISWFLISGVMPLGHNFVKVHLSQLLLLWKNAIPKIFAKDRFTEKSTMEISYLYHVRICALGSISSFLANNSKLITPDVARRIIQLLQNAMMFANAVPAKAFLDVDPSHQLDKSLTVQLYDSMLKRRILQCYVYLAQYQHTLDAFPANLLPFALSIFADPEKFNSAGISTNIAASAGSIDSIWQVTDNFAYGVTTNIQGFDIQDLQHERHVDKQKRSNSSMEPLKDVQESHWLSETDWLGELEKAANTPVLPANEQDVDILLHKNESSNLYLSPMPATTTVVNISIELFAALFPLQPSKIQESLLVQLSSYLYSSSSSPSRSDRVNATFVNASVALYSVLKYAFTFNARDNIKSSKVLNLMIKILKPILGSTDPIIRNVAAQSLGMTCSVAGSSSSAEVIKYLIDEIVKNRDPNSRAGCSVSLGYILKYVGGMFAGLHLKTVVGILTSLANDPHPIVHFWSLEAISITIASVGLSFSNYSLSTLTALSKLYLQETHGDEMPSVASSNLDIYFPTYRIIARCVHALIDIMGPDLQESSKSQEIVLSMIQQFQLTDDYVCIAESIRASQELIIFAPRLIDLNTFVKPLTTYLMIPHQTPIKSAAIDSLYQLIRTGSKAFFQYSGGNLKRDIWLAYDTNTSNETIRNFIKRWAEQTAETESLEWVSRVQMVLFKSRKDFRPEDSNKTKDVEANLADEEVEGFASANDGEKSSSNTFDEPLKWQTRVLAVEVLRDMLQFNLKDKSLEEIENNRILSRIGDIIRIAFASATGSILELRLLGVQLLNDVLVYLQDTPDPDFREVALLEQYQAQISSALTPAFTGDTSPELAAQAINVCATFIGIGIIKSVDRMGRILKLLISSLESCTGKEIQLGDLKSLGPNAQVMLKMAILSSWADLQVAGISKEYLKDVVSPFTPVLVPLWLSSLREFAELRFEPEQSSSLSDSSLGGSIDHMYSALSRNSILPFYQKSWLQLVDAIASILEHNPNEVFNILNEKNDFASDPNIQYGSEPAAFFFVLFGILFESLIRPQSTMGFGESNTPELRGQILSALKRILHPAVCGNAIYKDLVFIETVDILDRLVLTGSVAEQQLVVDIAYRLCINHPDNQNTKDSGSSGLSERVDQLFELVRIVMLALTNLLPFLADQPTPSATVAKLSKPLYISLIREALSDLVGMVEVFPTVIRVDLYACLLYVFGKILEQTDVIGDTVAKVALVPFKVLLTNMTITRRNTANTEYTNAIDQSVAIVTTQLVTSLQNVSSTSTPQELAQKELSLLTLVIVFKAAAPILKPSTPTTPGISPHVLNELAQILVESITVSAMQKVAAECLRALLSTSHQSKIGQALIVKTIPSLVALATGDGSSSIVQSGARNDDYDNDDNEGVDEDLVVEAGNGDTLSAQTIKQNRSNTYNLEQAASIEAAQRVPILVIEILVEFVKSLNSETEGQRIRAMMSITIPLLLWYCDPKNGNGGIRLNEEGENTSTNSAISAKAAERQAYVNKKLLGLVSYSSSEFKVVLQQGLTDWQRQMTQYVMLNGGQQNASAGVGGDEVDESANPQAGVNHIELKSFG